MTPTPLPRRSLLDRDQYLGHKRLRDELASAVSAGPGGRANIELRAPRRAGKTWLLDWLHLTSRPWDGVVVAKLNGAQMRDALTFHQGLARALRENLGEYSELVEVPGELETAGRELLAAVQELADFGGPALILLLDEFETAVRKPSFTRDVLRELRELANRPNVSLVVATTRPLSKAAHSDISDSPFFNVFQTMTIGPWSRSDVEAALLAWVGASSGLRRGVATELHSSTGGWPLACALVVERLLKEEVDISVTAVQSEFEALFEQVRDDLDYAISTAASIEAKAGPLLAALRDGPRDQRQEHAPAVAVLRQFGLARVEGNRLVLASRLVERAVRALDEGAIHFAPSTWSNWSTALADTFGVGDPDDPRVRRALRRLEAARDPLDVFGDMREFAEAVLAWLATLAAIPATQLKDDAGPVDYRARTHRGAQLAHLRATGELGDAADPLLGKHLSTLTSAGGFGAHREGQEPSRAEATAMLLLAWEVVRRIEELKG